MSHPVHYSLFDHFHFSCCWNPNDVFALALPSACAAAGAPSYPASNFIMMSTKHSAITESEYRKHFSSSSSSSTPLRFGRTMSPSLSSIYPFNPTAKSSPDCVPFNKTNTLKSPVNTVLSNPIPSVLKTSESCPFPSWVIITATSTVVPGPLPPHPLNANEWMATHPAQATTQSSSHLSFTHTAPPLAQNIFGIQRCGPESVVAPRVAFKYSFNWQYIHETDFHHNSILLLRPSSPFYCTTEWPDHFECSQFLEMPKRNKASRMSC